MKSGTFNNMFVLSACLILTIGSSSSVLCENLNAHHRWEIKDGNGCQTIRDSIGGLDGTIVNPEKTTWAQEDDRGFFLNIHDGSVEIPDRDDLNYPDGFIAKIRFSADFGASGDAPWLALFSKGAGYQNGYSVMLDANRKKILISLRGITPAHRTVNAELQNNRDYELLLMLGNGKMRIALDGKQLAEYETTGTLTPQKGNLYLGSQRGTYKFYGNLYYFEISPYQSEVADKTLPTTKSDATSNLLNHPKAAHFPPLNLTDPPGTVIVSDFSRFSPAPMITASGVSSGQWVFRKEAHMINPDSGILHPPSYGNEIMELDPQLNDIYDVYIAARAVAAPTKITIGLGNEVQTIHVPAGDSTRHYNLEQPFARNLKMENKLIRLFPANSNFYLGYLKFIPVAQRRSQDYPPIPGFAVEKTSPPTAESLEKTTQEKIREQIASGYFTERKFLEQRKIPEPGPRALQRGFLLFAQPWMDLLFPNSIPEQAEEQLRLTVSAARGEFEPVSFAIHGLRKVAAVQLRQSGKFVNSSGDEMEIKAKLSTVESGIKRTSRYTGQSEFMKMPYYLEPTSQFNLNKGESRQFWITLQVPDNTPGGLYQAEFLLNAENGLIEEKILVELTVYPFSLAQAEGYDLGFWTNLANSDEARQTLADMANYGVTSIVVSSSSVLSMEGDSLQNIKINFEQSLLSVVAESFRLHKFPGRIFLLSEGIMEKACSLPPGDQATAYAKLIEQLEHHRKAKQWPKLVYNSYDEVLSRPQLLPDFIAEVKQQKELELTTANDHIWYKTARPYQKEIDEVTNMIDIFLVRFNTRKLWYVDSWENMITEAKRRNVELIAYNSNNALTCSKPEAMRFITGWFFRSIGAGASGQLIWTYHYVRSSPLNDLDGTDFCYMVPPIGQLKGGPILDYIGFREGVDDLRYIITLENRIEQAQQHNVDSSVAEQLLKTLSGSFDLEQFRNKSVYFDSLWDKTWEKDGKRYASGRFNLPNGWDFEDYDDARRKIAAEILNLQKQLSGKTDSTAEIEGGREK